MLSVAINGSFTLDESPGLQTSGVATAGEDNNDNDVQVSTLPAVLSGRLFGTGAGQLGLSTSFATADGAAKSADNFITVSGPGTVTGLGFSKADGSALPVLGGAQPGVASGISAVTGGAVSLFADSVLGNRAVIGVDAANDVVFAMFLDPATGLGSAKVWTVQFEPISNPDATNPDDGVAVTGLGVAADVTNEFNFNALPSGQNLFGTVGDTATGLVVIGQKPVLNADGTFTNTSNTINTSQGGGPTTIGVDNQMFDVGDGAFFTFVKNPVPDFLAGAPNGLDQNEADDVDNIQYTGGTLEVFGGSVTISQIQGNSLATMDITAFDIAGAPQGRDLVNSSGTKVPITAVHVVDSAGQPVAATITIGTGSNGIPSGVARVAGVGAGNKISFTTSAKCDQVLVKAVAGKFDVGGFGVDQPSASASPLSGVRFEDDGPTITGTITGAPTLTVDETVLATDASGNFAGQFTSNFGTDGAAAASSVTYALSTPGGDSGLVDTATGQTVNLSLVGGQIQGRTATSNDLVFTVSVDATGKVTLDQLRAIVHPDATNADDSKTLLAAGSVKLTATATDKDSDTAAATIDIGQQLVIKDDGPSITGSIVNAPVLTVDESNLAVDASANFAGQFTAIFGADGAGSTPVSYALSTSNGSDSGLVDTATGEKVLLSLVGGVVHGRTAATNLLAFTVSVDATGKVTLDQVRAIVHADTTNPDDSRTLASASLVTLTATATDKDGDAASAPLDIGLQLVIKDDGPTLGPISSSIVDFLNGASATKGLHGAVGADGNATPYAIVNSTSTITVNGVVLQAVVASNKQSVTYFADTSKNGVFGDAGDTPYYKLTLDETGAGAYTFQVLVDPPPAVVNFNFNALPSGQNLFGTVGDTATGLVVIGKLPVLNADGTFTNTSNTINTSQGGGPTTIGVDNQMFDAGEGAFFTLVKNPVADFLAGAPNGLDQNEADDADNIQYTGGTLEVDSAFASISQIQGNSLATMDITAFNMAGSPQGQAFAKTGLGTGTKVSITAVHVVDALGNPVATATIKIGTGSNGVPLGVARVGGLGAGNKITWDTSGKHDQVLIQDVAGKFDIGGFGITQPAPTPDQKLDFTVKVTDGDGDSSTSIFSIGIDGTGIFHDGIVSGVTNGPFTATRAPSLFGDEPVGDKDSLADLLA